MTKLHSYLTKRVLPDVVNQDNMNIIQSLMTEPLWEITVASKEEFTEGECSLLCYYFKNITVFSVLKFQHVV